ncbi:hypothetical protein Phum_PHUM037670 [Pediculus humanus corporis]|uniref:Uncharacterized protein n=1 Tax=Pediculus humanus subsp. corporis TaxID=121224 RepID=E0VAG7_PEDHC|nr:uncharacterized protein Phum_PHUM037670 [Pediculus humanus corporis]EEB10373.1 hypothetical protein Phum_PHUM037670 [Pediculus humanus corporis]
MDQEESADEKFEKSQLLFTGNDLNNENKSKNFTADILNENILLTDDHVISLKENSTKILSELYKKKKSNETVAGSQESDFVLFQYFKNEIEKNKRNAGGGGGGGGVETPENSTTFLILKSEGCSDKKNDGENYKKMNIFDQLQHFNNLSQSNWELEMKKGPKISYVKCKDFMKQKLKNNNDKTYNNQDDDSKIINKTPMCTSSCTKIEITGLKRQERIFQGKKSAGEYLKTKFNNKKKSFCKRQNFFTHMWADDMRKELNELKQRLYCLEEKRSNKFCFFSSRYVHLYF